MRVCMVIIISSVLAIATYTLKDRHSHVTIVWTTSEHAPIITAQNTGILGSTPHPTYALFGYHDTVIIPELAHIIDKEYYYNSWKEILDVCNKNSINQLIVAYLPVYFVELQKIWTTQTGKYAEIFFEKSKEYIINTAYRASQDVQFQGTIVIVIPVQSQFDHLSVEQLKDRTYSLFTDFPQLSISVNYTITIFNTYNTHNESKYLYELFKNTYPQATWKLQFLQRSQFHQYIPPEIKEYHEQK